MTKKLAHEAAAWQAIQQAAAASKAFVAKWQAECKRLGYEPDSRMGKAVGISLVEESDKINDAIARRQRTNEAATVSNADPAKPNAATVAEFAKGKLQVNNMDPSP